MVKKRILAALAAATMILAGSCATVHAQNPAPPASPAPAPAVIVAPAPAPVAPDVLAVDPASAADALAAAGMAREYGMSWREAWQYGGIIMWFILALSILGGALVLYFFIILRPGQVAPRSLLSELRDRLADGDLNATRRACENRSCALASVSLVALDYIRSAAESDAPQLKDMIEAEGGRQANELESQTQYLLDISVISPMLGLLGTVLGMLKAFGSIAHDVTAAKPIILAQGVSQAIITTIFGLIVAIPCMVFYAYFRRRSARMVSLLEASSAELLTSLACRRKP